MTNDTRQYYCPKCGFPMDRGVCRKCLPDGISGEEEDARKKINGAAICGIISFGVTLIVGLTGLLAPGSYYILDLVLLAGLTLGVFLKNRGCAIALFIYWIISKLIMLTNGLSGWLGLPVGILFGVFFYRAIPGTFALHRVKFRASLEPAEGSEENSFV